MDDALRIADADGPPADQDRRISEVIQRESRRLFHFIRKRVEDEDDAEDILQEVFYELIEAYRLMKPVEQVGAWLYRVARNRIIDSFRKNKARGSIPGNPSDADAPSIEDLLASKDAGPEAEYARTELFEELAAALEELPDEQRAVFIAHEIEGRSFKELAAETGLSVNTLLSRKHYAILYLRRRLQAIYEDFMEL